MPKITNQFFRDFENNTPLDILPEKLWECAVPVSFPPNSVIVHAGDPPEYVYFIISGTARGSKAFEDGEEYEYFYMNCNDNGICLLELFAQEPANMATVTAVTECRTLRFSAEQVLEFILNDVNAMHRCLYFTSRNLYRCSYSYGAIIRKSALERVVVYLQQTYHTGHLTQEDVLIDATFADIAATLGLSTRTIGRCMSQLCKQGLLEKDKKKYRISKSQFEKISQLWTW